MKYILPIAAVLLSVLVLGLGRMVVRANEQTSVTFSGSVSSEALYALNSSGDFPLAEALSAVYVRENPDMFDGWVHRAVALYGVRRCSEAMDAIATADLLSPSNPIVQQIITGIQEGPLCKDQLTK